MVRIAVSHCPKCPKCFNRMRFVIVRKLNEYKSIGLLGHGSDGPVIGACVSNSLKIFSPVQASAFTTSLSGRRGERGASRLAYPTLNTKVGSQPAVRTNVARAGPKSSFRPSI
jgi:hypothetical protein